MPYYMIFNSASGALQSYGYSSDALPLPAGAIECTAAQYAAAPWVELQAGAIVAITPPAPPAPTPAQQATAAINAGVEITSTSTAALNATYPINATAQAQISAEVTAILLNGTFADGASTVIWLDVTGAQHTFTVAQFKTFASAVAAYVSGWTKFATGIVTTAPTQPVTIP